MSPPRPSGPRSDVTVRLGASGARPKLQLTETHLRVTAGQDLGSFVPCSRREVRVGKGTENQLVLSDPAVSRQHFSVRASGEQFVITDLGSTNGTRVNGARVREAEVESGCEIRVGATTLVLQPVTTELTVRPHSGSAFQGLVGESAAMRELFGYLDVVAPTNLSVVIQGETGSGKELVARAVHAGSGRANGPFVVFDCGAADPALIGAALYGHAAGAYTGAVGSRLGAFVAAHEGTLFLDEIGELPLELQPKLLRALERGEIQHLGSDSTTSVDVRVVCATHRDLPALVAAKRFREDLLYRLSGLTLVIPPLRDHKEDIAVLARHFVQTLRPDRQLSLEALQVLTQHAWPGNVRELRHAIERMVALARQPVLGASDVVLGALRPGASSTAPAGGLTGAVEHAEEAAIRLALKESGGNRSMAARRLGVARTTLRRKLEDYGIKDDGEDA